MLKRGDETNLARKALGTHFPGGVGRQHFHDNLSAQIALLGQEDTTHPATAKFAQERVRVPEGVLELNAQLGCHRGPLWGSTLCMAGGRIYSRRSEPASTRVLSHAPASPHACV